MDQKLIFLTSVPRSGNVFLGFCLKEAKKNNDKQHIVQIAQNIHNPLLLALDQTANAKFYTTLRDPLSNIVSSTARRVLFAHGPDYRFDKIATDFNESILSSIVDYKIYLENQNKYMKSTIVLFDNLISDPHSVIKKILKDVDIEYVYTVDIDVVKEKIRDLVKDISGKGDFVGSYHNLPFGIEKTEYYNFLVEKINGFQEFSELKKIYSETIEKANACGHKVY